jgi:hypothetical protein
LLPAAAGRTHQGMTDTTSRQPKGIPVGGQFAATAHSEADLSLSPSPAGPATLAERLAQRDASKERMERLYEQKDALDRTVQAQSVRYLAASLLERYPDAAVLTIRENEDGENNYEPLKLTRADGSVINESDTYCDWASEYDDNDPCVRDLVWDLDIHNDGWTDGIGAVVNSSKQYGKTAQIDLASTKDAPLPEIPEVHDPYQRTFTEDEQKALVDAAFEGVSEMNDKLTERAGDYSPAELAQIQEDMDAAVKVLYRADDV